MDKAKLIKKLEETQKANMEAVVILNALNAFKSYDKKNKTTWLEDIFFDTVKRNRIYVFDNIDSADYEFIEDNYVQDDIDITTIPYAVIPFKTAYLKNWNNTSLNALIVIEDPSRPNIGFVYEENHDYIYDELIALTKLHVK